MSFFNDIEDKIIDVLNENDIDRISMAGIIGTLRDDKLNEKDFLDYIKNKKDLCIEDCTDKLWDMRGYY